ncbi:MAG: DUF4129 domain-containing protein [Mycobacterium leprae]
MLTFWRRRGWLYRWALAALAETGAAIPWLLLFYSTNGTTGWERAMPGPWVLLLTYLVAGLWEVGVKKAKENPWRRILTMLPAVIIVYLIAYATLPPALQEGLLSLNLALSVMPVAAYLWFQGTKGAAEGIVYDRVFVRFVWQIISLIVAVALLVLLKVVDGGTVNLLLYWSVLLLFGAGLLLLVVTRDRTLRQGQAKLGDEATGSGALSRALTWVILGLVVLTVVASQLLTTENLMALGRSVWGLLDGPVSWLIDVTFLLIHRLVFLLWSFITLMIHLFFERKPWQPKPEDVELGDPQDYMQPVSNALNALGPYVRAALIVAMVIGVVLLIYKVTGRIQSEDGEEEERVSLGFWANLIADLKSLFGGAARAVTAAMAAAVTEALDPTDPRSIYRRFQAYGEGLGRPRGPAETPNAYRGTLTAAKPEAGPAAVAVTSVYNEARYGAAAPSVDRVEQAAEALTRLEGKRSDDERV